MAYLNNIAGSPSDKTMQTKESGDKVKVTSNRRFICNKCNKAFSKRGCLEAHLLNHVGIKPFSCNICHKTFSAKQCIKPHLKTHYEEKEHICDVCNRAFYERSHLNAHRLTHTTVKPHECNMCSKTFLKRSNLKRHYLMHTGEKPYACDFCSEVFTHKSSLNCHLKLHARHGDVLPIKNRQITQEKMFENLPIDNVQLKRTIRTYSGLKKNNQKHSMFKNPQ